MMVDTAEIIGDLISRLPPEARADVGAHQIVAAAVAAGVLAASQPEQSPIRIQRVDEFVAPGEYDTSFEVVDARKPKAERVVRSFPVNDPPGPRGATEEAHEAAISDAYAKAREEAAKHAPVRGAAYTLAAVDSDEYFHDTDYEVLGNQGTYGIIVGCAVTEDATDLTADLAAGTILHSGSAVNVAAATDAYTLVADASNERWTAACLSSAGAAVLVSGDAAASSSVEPTKPEIGDRVLLKLWKVQAAQTVANNAEYKLDKRIMLRGPFTVILGTNFDNTQSNTVLENVTAVAFPLAPATRYAFEALIVYRSGTTPDYKAAFTVPASSTIHYKGLYTAVAGSEPTAATIVLNASAGVLSAEGDAADRSILVSGHVLTDATAGNLQLQSAQVTGDASATTTKAGTWLRVTRV